MRKTALKLLGGFLLLGGILMMVVAGKVTESSRPREVRSGVMYGDQFVETDRGYIGGNPEAAEDMGYLKVLGVMVMVLGGGMFIVSFKAED